jgi:hypothetical protein
MANKMFFSLIMLMAFCSCNSRSAFNYSQDIVKKEQSLTQDITSTEDKIKIYFEKEQFDSIAVAGARMENIVNTKLNEIKEQPAPDVKESAGFKDASIKYFQFIKSMYTGYKEFGNASTAAGREKEMGKLRQILLQKTEAITEMQKAQKKFAEANGFKLEGN